jgi:hypothetical protein
MIKDVRVAVKSRNAECTGRQRQVIGGGLLLKDGRMVDHLAAVV